MASASTSCSVKSTNRFTGTSSKGWTVNIGVEVFYTTEKSDRMRLDCLRRGLEPAILRVLHLYWRLSRGMTLGVRAVVVDDLGRVFLVKHSYVTGWHLPGGGVEPGGHA